MKLGTKDRAHPIQRLTRDEVDESFCYIINERVADYTDPSGRPGVASPVAKRRPALLAIKISHH
jgi:hypothetical protein